MQTPPRFFRLGPSPLAKLFFFVLLSIFIMIADHRSELLSEVRRVIGTIIYPLQQLAHTPFQLRNRLERYVSDFKLIKEIDFLRREYLASQYKFLQLQALTAENKQLRALLGAAQQTEIEVVLAEILHTPRDPFNRKITLNKGNTSGVKEGQVVIDDLGVIGQVTQVYPWTSEVTLITDKDHSVPVQIARNALRTVISGAGRNNQLELRFLSINADVRKGDLLITSGIGGVYPSGLPVGRIAHIEYDRSREFARIICTPVAGVDRHRQVLILIASPHTTFEDKTKHPDAHATQSNQQTQSHMP
ncbi:MAG TPA: rod shape-determining protein MreC [Nitrosomonas halophila]|nr:rod shape-determining protein MreC [Nitrosomonas halophila]